MADIHETIRGSQFDDSIEGTDFAETILSAAGDDFIFGNGGNDVIKAGKGNDVVDAGAGDDDVRGHAGDDRLGGGDGNDTLLGGAGSDLLDGGEGEDTFTGGAGNDSFVMQNSAGYDIVTDFDVTEDELVFGTTGFTGEFLTPDYTFDAISIEEGDGFIILQGRGTDTQLNGLTLEDARDITFRNLDTNETYTLPDYHFA